MTQKQHKAYHEELHRRLETAMPLVREQVARYERRKKAGQLTQNPKPAPQFGK